jgi:hypothetical protein
VGVRLIHYRAVEAVAVLEDKNLGLSLILAVWMEEGCDQSVASWLGAGGSGSDLVVVCNLVDMDPYCSQHSDGICFDLAGVEVERMRPKSCVFAACDL